MSNLFFSFFITFTSFTFNSLLCTPPTPLQSIHSFTLKPLNRIWMRATMSNLSQICADEIDSVRNTQVSCWQDILLTMRTASDLNNSGAWYWVLPQQGINYLLKAQLIIFLVCKLFPFLISKYNCRVFNHAYFIKRKDKAVYAWSRITIPRLVARINQL